MAGMLIAMQDPCQHGQAGIHLASQARSVPTMAGMLLAMQDPCQHGQAGIHIARLARSVPTMAGMLIANSTHCACAGWHASCLACKIRANVVDGLICILVITRASVMRTRHTGWQVDITLSYYHCIYTPVIHRPRSYPHNRPVIHSAH